MRLYLFDIDGTLLLAGGAGSEALELAFEELFGLRAAMRRVRCDGKTDLLIAREVLAPHGLDGPDEIERVLARYLEHLPGLLARSPGFHLMPGAAACLELMRSRALPLGLATGNLEAGARAKLARGGLSGTFAFGGFGSDAEQRPALVRLAVERGRALIGDPAADAVVFGDTPADVTGAHRAGAELVLDSLQDAESWLPAVEALPAGPIA